MLQLRGQIHSPYVISTLYMYSVVCTLVLCSLAAVLSCIGPSVRLVTNIPKVGPLLKTGSLKKRNTALEYSTRVVQEGAVDVKRVLLTI